MDTARDLSCQPARVQVGRGGAAIVVSLMLLAGGTALASGEPPSGAPAAAAAASPSPTPVPAWQRDLDGLVVLQVAAALTPNKADAEGKTPGQRLTEGYTRLGRQYPDQPEVQKACGDFFFEAGETEQAFAFWLRSQQLAPGNPELASTLGSAYLKAGNTREAAAQFQRAVDARPDLARFHSDLANVLYLFRRELVHPPTLPDPEAVLASALEHFRLAAQLAPTDLRIAKAYAETFYAMAKPDWAQALAAWQTVLALSGDDPDFANSHLARINLRMGRPRDAETYLDRLRRPEFVPLQAKLREQARKMEAGAAAK